MTIQYTKVTWYSKLIALILFILLPVWGFYLGRKYERAAMPQTAGYESTVYTSGMDEYISKAALLTPSHDGKIFVAYKLLGDSLEGSTKTLYVWAYIQEYYVEDGKLQEGSGMSVPIAIQARLIGKYYLPVSYEIPQDGGQYAVDVKRIFPTEFHDFIFGKDVGEKNDELRKLEKQLQVNAKNYYKL
jgi:hypothetical protein